MRRSNLGSLLDPALCDREVSLYHREGLTRRLLTGVHFVQTQALKTDLGRAEASGEFLLVIPGDKVFKTSVLSKQIGSSRLSFAAPEYMERYLDITPGSLSILGLMNDHDKRVKLLIDGDVLSGEYIGVHPCINTSSLRIRPADLTETLIPALGHEPTMVSL